MMNTSRARMLSLAVILLFCLATPLPASARAILVHAYPAPNQTLDKPPAEVRLTFNTSLEPDNFVLTVVDAVGVHVDNADARMPGRDQRTILVSLPPLDEGLYTVTYTVTDTLTEVTTSDSYQFALDFPTPQIRFAAPPNGAGLVTDALEVEVDTGDFDLVYWQHWWRLYLDGEPYLTTRQPRVTLRNLSPGPHELQAVLVNHDEMELLDTRTTIYVAIGQPDPAAEAIARAATAPGDPGLTLSATQAAVLASAVLLCLGMGIVLGRRSKPDET